MAWRGGLPVDYRLGGDVILRLELAHEWQVVPLRNVVARIEGSEWPNEWILRGNNHDAWNHGALVAGSGLVAMLEEARAIGSLLRSGWRPKRTMVYLAWDGEELGLMGSTEWVEKHATVLRERAVAYLNTGVTTRGSLVAGGSHALETLVDEVARSVRDPLRDATLLERATQLVAATAGAGEGKAEASAPRYRLAPLGLGSDFGPFLHHLGIPSLDYAFDGAAEVAVYHSIYDTFDFYDRFGDPGFVYGRALAEAGGRTVLRLAEAAILPFDFAPVAEVLTQWLEEISALVERGSATVDLAPLRRAAARLEVAATSLTRARSMHERSPDLPRADLAAVNALLRRAEQRLAPAGGLPERPWYRHLLYAPESETGYRAITLPGLREAIERGDFAEAESEAERLAEAVSGYAADVAEAAARLERAEPSAQRSAREGPGR